MRYLIIIGILSISGSFCLFSQTDFKPENFKDDLLTRLENSSGNGGKVKISMDSLVEENYYKDLLYNQKHSGIKGFRIRIFTSSGTNAYLEAQKTLSRFISMFDDVGAYIKMDASDYKVYVGDFRTKSEALKMFIDEIQPKFPNAFIVPYDDIKIDKQ